MNSHYKKYYLPGYTGHVPKKNEMFGMTAGDVNKLLVTSDPETVLYGSTTTQKTFYSAQTTSRDCESRDMTKYGNQSRKAINWIAGPTHEIYPQHIPGFTGHIPSLKSENMYGKAYAKITAISITGKVFKGANYPPEIRYKTTTQEEFNKNNFRRFVEAPHLYTNGDYYDYANQLNQENDRKNSTMRSSSIGFGLPDAVLDVDPVTMKKAYRSTQRPFSTSTGSGFASTFRNTIASAASTNRDAKVTIKPKALEKEFVENPEYMRLSDGFKKVFVQEKEEVVIPVVGYQGHRKAHKAKNFYGKSFRSLTIDSKRVQRNI